MSESAQATEPEGGAAPEVSPDIERRARNMGWQPRDKWDRPSDRWVDAETFVERAERRMPLLLERNRAMDETITGLRGEMQEQKQLLADMVHRSRKAEKIGYDRALRELQVKRAEAVRQGDAEAFSAVEHEIHALGPAPEPAQPNGAHGTNGANGAPPAQGAPAQNPVVVAWVRRNRWFNTDPIANAAAIAALGQVEREYPGDPLEDHLIEVENRIRSRFPEHFPAPRRAAAPEPEPEPEPQRDTRRRAAPMVSASSSAPERRHGPRSFEAMPADVKAQFERQRRALEGKGKPLTREEFAEYFWESEPEA